MKIRTIILIGCLSATAASCVKDDSTLDYVALPKLSIAGSEAEEMPVMNFDLGESCIITPDITYTGNEADLQYTWSIGIYRDGVKGSLEEVGKEKTLNHFFTSGGSYYAHLVVTDGSIGDVIDYRINMNRTFEEGYVLVSNDEAGNGNLAFVKIMTPEEIEAGKDQVYVEHCLELMNEGTEEKNLVGVVNFSGSIWTGSGSISYNRLIVSSDDRCYFLDPNNFTVNIELRYDDVKSGFRANRFCNDAYKPFLFDTVTSEFIHLDPQYTFAYENSQYVSSKRGNFNEVFSGSYSQWGTLSYINIFVNYDTPEASELDMNYGLFGGTGETTFANKDIRSAFIGKMDGYSPTRYVLSVEGDEGCLSSFSSIYYFSILPESYPKKDVTFSLDGLAVPERGTRFVYSGEYFRHYYAIKNNVYVFIEDNPIPLSKATEAAITFPEKETVTFLDINGTELYVATYDNETKRGNFYVYDVENVTSQTGGVVTPKAAHMNCADKIVSAIYKPSMQ